MRYTIYLIFILSLMLFSASAAAQQTRYRVELIVLTHLNSVEEPRETGQLPDYSTALDFLTPVVEEEAVECDDAEMTPEEALAAEVGPVDEDANGEPEDEEEPEDPNRVFRVEEMSDVMQETWRRLRLSGPFRPEQYLSWEQGSEEPFPTLRLHDLDAVLIDDPWASQRAAMRVAAEEAALQAEDDCQAAPFFTGPPLPDPVTYYRLDGTARLLRSRFLHLELNLQLREALWDAGQPRFTLGEDGEATPLQPSAFRVYAMKQSRQVRTRRMEYFDGPKLGVLAWVTEVEIEEEDENTP